MWRFSFDDFVTTDDADCEAGVSIRPLVFAEVHGQDRLLVVSCHYLMADGPADCLRFDVDPSSVTFHLFEAIDGAKPPKASGDDER